MEEIKVKNNTLGLKVYTISELQTSGEDYELRVFSFPDGLEKRIERENGEEDSARCALTGVYSAYTNRLLRNRKKLAYFE